MKKKLLSALLCAAMVASLVVGCGSKEEAAVEEPAATEEAAPVEEEAEVVEEAEAVEYELRKHNRTEGTFIELTKEICGQ